LLRDLNFSHHLWWIFRLLGQKSTYTSNKELKNCIENEAESSSQRLVYLKQHIWLHIPDTLITANITFLHFEIEAEHNIHFTWRRNATRQSENSARRLYKSVVTFFVRSRRTAAIPSKTKAQWPSVSSILLQFRLRFQEVPDSIWESQNSQSDREFAWFCSKCQG
jgi:hypothetical protein